MSRQTHREIHYSNGPTLHDPYSYLSAVTGSRREADHAGAKPEKRPVSIETAMLTTTRVIEK